jgi:TetR/AcrR family transcriptional repressor of nem operon
MNKPLSTADDLLTCARSLIVAGGYNGFSYADIARVVGIRKPRRRHRQSRARAEAEAFMATVHGAMSSARAYGDTTGFGTIMDAQLARLSAGA